MTILNKRSHKYNDGKSYAWAHSKRFLVRVERKSTKTKRYWFELWTKGLTRSNFCSGNMLEVTNVYADSAAEAKMHLINSLKDIAQELEELIKEIEELEVYD